MTYPHARCCLWATSHVHEFSHIMTCDCSNQLLQSPLPGNVVLVPADSPRLLPAAGRSLPPSLPSTRSRSLSTFLPLVIFASPSFTPLPTLHSPPLPASLPAP
jgi:hypothetical protein